MPYLQLRITCDPSGSVVTDHRVFLLMKKFIRDWLTPQDPSHNRTMGVEEHNHYGEVCDKHFHLHAVFDPSDLKDPLRSAKNWLKRQALEAGFSLKGNKRWACTLVEEPEDYERWLRYPLKEGPLYPQCQVDLEYNLHQMATDANHEHKRTIEINILKREKAIDKQSFKDKLFKYLDSPPDGGDHPKTHCSIWIAILQYYMEQGKAVCYKTITGYTDLYLLHKGLKTPLEAYAQAMGQKCVQNPNN